jgi:hypothetical protein
MDGSPSCVGAADRAVVTRPENRSALPGLPGGIGPPSLTLACQSGPAARVQEAEMSAIQGHSSDYLIHTLLRTNPG